MGQKTAATASTKTAQVSATAPSATDPGFRIGADDDSIKNYVEPGGQMERDLNEIREMHASLLQKIEKREEAMEADDGKTIYGDDM